MPGPRTPAYLVSMWDWLLVAGLMLGVGVATRATYAHATGELGRWRICRAASALARRFRRPEAEVVQLRRPVELVGADLYRLHTAFHRGGMRFAKYEGCRQAYDRVLAEAADMVGITHLVRLLAPGAELDSERQRVELLLRHHGMLPPYAA